MLLRRRISSSRAAGLPLCVLRAALRCSSSFNNDSSNDHNTHAGFKSDKAGSVTSDDTVTPSGFKGWKRLNVPRDDDAASQPQSEASALTPPSVHNVVGQKRAEDEARKRAASERLADMFVESGRHAQWMQEQHQTAAPSQRYHEGRSSIKRVVPQRQQHQRGEPGFNDGGVDFQETASVAQTAMSLNSSTGTNAGKASNCLNFAYDEDEGLSVSPDGAAFSEPLASNTALTHTTPTDILEQELLDDNFLYYPPPAALSADDVNTTAPAEPHSDPAKERYVPGQQIIPPGFTRYRVDVQYQGSDFNGWYKSVQRTRLSSTRKEEKYTRNSMAEGGSRHYARKVLEEALAVALDVASVTVVAAVIPETGVSVRRLTCHVDIPSEVELQPRTILQRATLWLHQRNQPLAVLSCHPCRNQDFHARHSGVRRIYCYRILNRIAPPLFDAGLQWHVDRYLDVARMQRMARVMEGTHDYGYFADPKMANALRRAAAAHTGGGPVVSSAYSPEHEPLTSHGLPSGQAPAAPKVPYERGLSQLERAAALPTFNEYGQRVVTYQAKPREYHKAHTNLPTVRTIDKIDVVRQEDEVLIWFVGQSFLRHQIRNMVSVLKAGGHGLWDDQELQHAFQCGFEVSRKKFERERLPPAPVHGLTLWDVEYPAQHMSDFVSYVDAGPYESYDISSQH